MRILGDELLDIPRTVELLDEFAQSAASGRLKLLTIDIPAAISTTSADLTQLDPSNAYHYASLVSAVDIVNKGLARLSALLLARAAAGDIGVGDRLDEILVGQAKILAGDFVAFGTRCS